ncbi:MAG: asparagine--tRNA ligase [Candidatus Enterosoma sp.]|nr:asparagine--tRNA ligase [bacterium]MDY5865710.1 asparagine--tRNA ligase [Candidatus Enterosoma sp.]
MLNKEITIKTIYQKIQDNDLQDLHNREIVLKGFVRNNRCLGQVGFLSVNDGSCFLNAQVVYKVKDEKITSIRLGSTVIVKGRINLTIGGYQPFEIESEEVILISQTNENYPLQKKKTSFDFLRTIPTLRMKTNTFNAVFRVRDSLSYNIHRYFHENGYVWIHTPIITANDCEGEGQTFQVVADNKHPEEYFNKDNVHLTVSGQLHVEPFALTYQRVYTFGPTFRAEKSNTTRHAAEFWMIEPEVAWCDMEGIMDVEEDFLKFVVREVRKECPQDFEFFYQRVDKDLKKRLDDFENKKFARVKYSDAINILKEAKKTHKFEVDDIEFGLDLGSEHERYLTEEVFKGPIFLTDYPKDIKAFYMKMNDDNKTVRGVDLLVPTIGELCGGSEREDSYDKLLGRMNELKMNIPAYEWYLDLRKNGSAPHSGFGLGFERMMMLLTGMTNIRDTLPYPRCYKDMLY